MRIILITIIITLSFSAYTQRIKKKDIVYSPIEEVHGAIEYLNKMRMDTEFASGEIGIHLNPNSVKRELIFDHELYEMAKLRVLETIINLIVNNRIGHITKHEEIRNKRKFECLSLSWVNNLKRSVRQYIEDKGVEGKGHRNTLMYDIDPKKIGYAGGMYNGKFITCVILY